MVWQASNNMKTKKIDNILAASSSSHSALQTLIRNANEKAHLQRVLRKAFPTSLSQGIKSVRKTGTTLSIECLNSAIATNIRFDSHNLLQKLSSLNDFVSVDEIKPFVGRFTVKNSDP